ncbi:hypothetical protein NDU88_004397 [Pleurodeles waltl]|uniref:Uncharacterized protein n=1 Tax=Pleurodeles waltl TaxID=8319 RepID=A0AAV7VKM0_PLEWA|nr:hypothetical protein NDU88_004397 [Pleurodeles waltl]
MTLCTVAAPAQALFVILDAGSLAEEAWLEQRVRMRGWSVAQGSEEPYQECTKTQRLEGYRLGANRGSTPGPGPGPSLKPGTQLT